MLFLKNAWNCYYSYDKKNHRESIPHIWKPSYIHINSIILTFKIDMMMDIWFGKRNNNFIFIIFIVTEIIKITKVTCDGQAI